MNGKRRKSKTLKRLFASIMAVAMVLQMVLVFPSVAMAEETIDGTTVVEYVPQDTTDDADLGGDTNLDLNIDTDLDEIEKGDDQDIEALGEKDKEKNIEGLGIEKALIGIMPFAYIPQDKSAGVEIQGITVQQEGNPISPGAYIDTAKSFQIVGSFKIDIADDETDAVTSLNRIWQNDYVVIELPEGLNFTDPTKNVSVKGIHVGGFQITAGTPPTVAITFTEDWPFDGEYTSVTVEFVISAEHDSTKAGDEIEIFGETYKLLLPSPPVTVEKTGVVNYNEGTITWKVVLDCVAPFDLDGFKLEDSMANSGMFDGIIDDSIKVSYDGQIPVEIEPYTNSEGGTISVDPGYIFNFNGTHTKPVEIAFDVKMSDAVVSASGATTVRNSAILFDNHSRRISIDEEPLDIEYKWITKNGQDTQYDDAGIISPYDSNNRAIKWTIMVNEKNTSMTGAVIKEVLEYDDNFRFDEIKITAIDDSATENVLATVGTDVNGELDTTSPYVEVKRTKADGSGNAPATSVDIFLAGNAHPITSTNAYKIEIIAKPINPEAIIHNATEVGNTATLVTTGSGPGAPIELGMLSRARTGVPGIEKWGISANVESGIPILNWGVKVDPKGQAYTGITILDLFIFGNETVDGSDLELGAKESGTVIAGIDALFDQYKTGSVVTYAAYGQKALDVTNPDNCDVAIYEIEKDGVVVGNLVVAESISVSGTDVVSFGIRAQATDPKKFLNNEIFRNTAILVNSANELSRDPADLRFNNGMLEKIALKATGLDESDLSTGVKANENASSVALNAYNYVDNSIVYKIIVNEPEWDFTSAGAEDALGQTAGAVTITDTLPDGWVFKDFNSKPQFVEVYDDLGTPVTTITPVVNDGSTGKELSLTFPAGFDETYTIFIKAGPSDAMVEANDGTDFREIVTNNVKVNFGEWDYEPTAKKDALIVGSTLSKSGSIRTNGDIVWTVDYMPRTVSRFGDSIVDTVPEEISVRLGADGSLLLEEEDGTKNITVTKLSPEVDGTYTPGDDVPLVVGGNIFYSNTSKELTFLFDTNYNGAYRIEIITDLVKFPESGKTSKIENTAIVKLNGLPTGAQSKADVSVSDRDVNASLQRGSSITVLKVDGVDNSPLAGAEFSLIAKNGTVLYSGLTTLSDGRVRVPLRRVGEYVLKETAQPAGYQLPVVDFEVDVEQGTSALDVYVDGELTTTDFIVKNYKDGTTSTLNLKATVSGNTGDTNKEFKFTVTIDTPADELLYVGNNGIPNGKFLGDGSTVVGTIDLKHNQSITIVDILDGADYTITGDAIVSAGYTVTSTIDFGSGKVPVSGGVALDVVFDHHKDEIIGGGRPGTIIEPGNKEKEPEVKEPEVKEPEIKEPEIKEPEVVQPKPEEPFTPNNIPDPNSQTSPNEFELVNENGETIGEYTKVKLSDGTYVYIDGSGNPLGYMDGTPMTGDTAHTALWVGLLLVALVAIFATLRKRPTTK